MLNHSRVAVNIIGQITIPHSQWIQNPYNLVCGGHVVGNSHNSHQTQATHHSNPTNPPTPQTNHQGGASGHAHSATPGTKFVLELNEPGDELPQQTRKFVLHFSNPVSPNVQSKSITFTPVSGGSYNGIMQLAYIGAGPRGDHSKDDVLDQYFGVYSYKPMASYCVMNNNAYASFDWNVVGESTQTASNPLLMIAMPHHVCKIHFIELISCKKNYIKNNTYFNEKVISSKLIFEISENIKMVFSD